MKDIECSGMIAAQKKDRRFGFFSHFHYVLSAMKSINHIMNMISAFGHLVCENKCDFGQYSMLVI